MQKDYTVDQRVLITHIIGQQMNESLRGHWKILSAKDGPNVYDCDRRNVKYIIERMSSYVHRANSQISSVKIYNLSEAIEYTKAATRMARVWHAMTPFSMMDDTLGKNIMDGLADVFENYQVEKCKKFDFTKIKISGRSFIPGTCHVQHDQRLDTFTSYKVNDPRPDMIDIFISAVAHIAWTVDGINIYESENGAQ